MKVEKFSVTEILAQILMFFFMMYLSDFKTIHDEVHLLPIFFFGSFRCGQMHNERNFLHLF